MFGRLRAIDSGIVAASNTATLKIDAAANGNVRVFLTVHGDASGPLLSLVENGYRVELFTTGNGLIDGTPNAGHLQLSTIQFLYVPHLSAVFTSAAADNLYVGGQRVEYGTAAGTSANGGRITSTGLQGYDCMYYNTDEVDLLYVKLSGGTGAYPSFAILEEDDSNADFLKIEAVAGTAQAPYVENQVQIDNSFKINRTDYYTGSIVLKKGGVSTSATISAYNDSTGVITFTAASGAYTPDEGTTYELPPYFKISKTNAAYTTTGSVAQTAKVMIYDSAARILGDGSQDGITLPIKIKDAPTADLSGFMDSQSAPTIIGGTKYYDASAISSDIPLVNFRINVSNYYVTSENSTVSIAPSHTLPSEFTEEAANHIINFSIKSASKVHAFGAGATADPKDAANVRTFAAGNVVVNYSNTTIKRSIPLNTNQTLSVGLYESIEYSDAPVVRVATTAPALGSYSYSDTFYADNNKVYANELDDADTSQVYLTVSGVTKGLGDVSVSATLNGNSVTLKNSETAEHGNPLSTMPVTGTAKVVQVQGSGLNLVSGDAGNNTIVVSVTDTATSVSKTQTSANIEGYHALTSGTPLPASFVNTLPVEQLTTSSRL